MKNDLVVPEYIALEIKECGFKEICLGYYQLVDVPYGQKDLKFGSPKYFGNHNDSGSITCSSPLYDQVIDWLDNKGFNISIIPEYYRDGINWNFQVSWYLTEDEWTEHVISNGSYWFGDNGEYRTRKDALNKAIMEAIKKIKEL